MNKPLKVFITYSHKNTAEKDELITRLTLLKGEGLISIWHDNEILPGDKWRDAIFDNLADADLLLYLTSAHSLASENCNKELAAALNAEIRVIPIILESCDWLNHQLSDFQALPDRGLPITKWENESEGWQNVVRGIRNTINKLQSQTDPSSEISEEELYSHQFERWAVEMVGGFVTTRKSRDDGVDGRLYFYTGEEDYLKAMQLQVKGGATVKIESLHALAGVVDEEDYPMGGFITRKTLGRMQKRNFLDFCRTKGTIEIAGVEYPKLQLLSVEEILAGERFKTPIVRG